MPALTLREILLGTSPDHQVNPTLLMRKLEEIESSNASGNKVFYEDTLANLNSVSSPPVDATGFVLDDSTPANNGVYLRGVSSWTKTAELPGAFSDSLGAMAAVTALEGTLGDLATEDDIPANKINDSTAAGRNLLTAADAGAQRAALDLGMLDTANDAVILGGETRVESSDYLLVIEDPNTGAVFAYVDAEGNAEGFGADTSATETEPLAAAKYSTDWTWFTSDVLAIIVGHGQSNARGQGTTATSTTPVYPGKALMPSNGPQVTGATGQALVDLVEVGTETPGSALVNNLIAKVAALTGTQPYVCYLNGAVSATPLRNLNRGSAAWNNIMGGIEDAVAWARSNGLTPVVLGMTWTQGEEGTDRPRTSAEYLADLDNLSRDFAADVKARTGQTYDPRLYATQIYSGHNNEPTDVQWAEWGPNLAAVEGHGRGLIRLAGPMYQLEIQTADYLHLTAAGQYAQGAMQAEAIYADWVGAGWSPIRPLRAWLRTSSIVRIEYAVPGGGDLEIVTGGAVTDTTNSTKGFQVFTAGRGSKLTISSVAVPTMTDVNDRYVDITLSAPVTGGVFVTYAMRRDTNGQNGPATGGRGCLATATTYTPLSGGAQRHWAAAHSITAGF